MQRNRSPNAPMTGRQAAPVLHEPGTSTMVGPAPYLVIVDASARLFDHVPVSSPRGRRHGGDYGRSFQNQY